MIGLFKLFSIISSHCSNLFFSNESFFNTLFGIYFFYVRVHLNLSLPYRLGEGRLIQFIMSKFSVTYNINYNIRFKLLSIFNSQFHNKINFFRMISINVENRGFNNFSNFSTMESRSVFSRGSSETDLIISYYVNNSSRSISFKIT
jgi:hypothetical protein